MKLPQVPSSFRHPLLCATAFAAVALLVPADLFAQAAEVAAAAPSGGVKKTLFDRIMGGGPAFMITLMLTSVFMVWLIIDTVIRSSRKKVLPPAHDARVRELLAAGFYGEARAFCAEGGSSYLSVVRAGLDQVGAGREAAEEALLAELDAEKAHHQSRISYLSVIGVVTPMIGLTGTVFGMIKAFDTLGQAGVGDPGKLSGAIGTVLVATAGGLVVAIPAFTAYYILRNLISGSFKELEKRALQLFRRMPYDQLAGASLDESGFVPGAPAQREA
jgi:biopolymer transport protein ExbB